MDLLFKRSQTETTFGDVSFKLWGKAEFDEEEQALIKRYRFDGAILIAAIEPWLLRKACLRGLGAFLLAWLVLFFFMSYVASFWLGLIAGIGVGYWYFHENRETIYVRDLMHGRYFACDSVVALARKEAWLETICAYLRQVMESAKHWDGETRFPIEPLPKDEARGIIIRGL